MMVKTSVSIKENSKAWSVGSEASTIHWSKGSSLMVDNAKS